jgi:flagellar hook-length control protein FliK
MQNLPLQMSQVAPLKKAEGTAGKINAGMEKAASAEKNASFQMVLSKQVQASAKPVAAEPAVLQQKRKAKAGNVQAGNIQQGAVAASNNIGGDKKTSAINKDTGLIGNVNTVPIDQIKLDAKTLLATKEDVDIKSENVNINIVDISAITLTATTLVPVMNAIPLVNTQAASVLTETNLTSQITTIPASTSTPEKQRNLDAMLNNALTQAKNGYVPEREAIEPQMAVEGEANADKTRQPDVMLPSIAKQGVGDESANVRLMLNTVRDGTVKEGVVKEVVMPAGLPSAAQVNTTLPAQQIASANIINAYPGKAGWDQAISQKVVWMVGAGQQSATLTLNPPDLGPLQVVIHVHNDQADTTFISDNAEVRQALQDGLANLRDKMSESGVQLGQTNVSSGQQSQQQFQQAMQSQRMSQTNNTNAVLPLEKTADANTLVRVSNGLVDTFA